MDASLHFHHFLNQSKQKQKQPEEEAVEKQRKKFVAYATGRYLQEVPGVIIGYNYERKREREKE